MGGTIQIRYGSVLELVVLVVDAIIDKTNFHNMVKVKVINHGNQKEFCRNFMVIE